MLCAGGGTRTRTTFYGPGILSPVRLPFRHTGNVCCFTTYNQVETLGLAVVRFKSMQATATTRKPRRDSYRKVFDSRKRRVRGCEICGNGTVAATANLSVADDLGRRHPGLFPDWCNPGRGKKGLRSADWGAR